MKSRLFGMVGVVILVLMLVGALFPLATPTAADNPIKPIIFVHGSGGSGAQFESQAMRFTSNGYPSNYLFAFEYDTSMPDVEGSAARMARLDAFVDTVLTSTGATQVYLMGHSRGTTESFTYLGVPARAAKVAKYVNIDGSTGRTAIVPTLALWATRGWSYNPANQIVGATNVFIPNQTHVQIATSAESFVEMYKFFTGNTPATNQIVPEPCDQIQISGRGMFYPQGTGVGNAALEIWEVNGATGARIGAVPKATYTLSGGGFTDGAWGPFSADGGQHYEFVIVRAGARPHHFYLEPFIRSNYFVRLLTSPTGGIGDLMERNMNSAALVITRNKEFWGNDTVSNDILTVNDTNIINAATCPIIKVPGFTGVIGIFAYDRYLNGTDNLTAPIPTFFAVGFMTGVDIYMPAADPPNGTISLVLTPRGGGGKTQVINIQNWASLNHSISVPFNDFLQQTEPVSVLTATDAGAATFSSDSGTVTCLSAIDEKTLPTKGLLGIITFPYGVFSFNITNITPGSTVTITIVLPSAVPVGTQYWKYQNGNWVDCTSLLGSNDGDNVLTLTITDGGLGDADGQANGTIVDPGGPALLLQTQGAHQVSPTLPNLKRAQISLQYMSVTPQQAKSNQPVTILTNVVNNGDQAGSLNVALKINGQVEQTKMVSVGPQATQPVKFTITKAQPGTYTVDILNQQGSFTIAGQSGSTAGKSVSGGLIALLVMAVLVLTTVVVLILSFRRPA